LIQIDNIASEALTDESQLRSIMQGIRSFIKNLLRGPRFARLLDALPNPIVTYARRRLPVTLTENEDLEDEVRPSQPAQHGVHDVEMITRRDHISSIHNQILRLFLTWSRKKSWA